MKSASNGSMLGGSGPRRGNPAPSSTSLALAQAPRAFATLNAAFANTSPNDSRYFSPAALGAAERRRPWKFLLFQRRGMNLPCRSITASLRVSGGGRRFLQAETVRRAHNSALTPHTHNLKLDVKHIMVFGLWLDARFTMFLTEAMCLSRCQKRMVGVLYCASQNNFSLRLQVVSSAPSVG